MKYPIKIKGKTIKQVTKLNLSGLGLKDFPENLFEYTNLTKLVLSNNRIKVIPKEILKLKKLKVLDLANNEITTLQSAVFKLPKLTTLNLYGNKIKKMPKQVFESCVTKLIIGKNPIDKSDIYKLKDFCELVYPVSAAPEGIDSIYTDSATENKKEFITTLMETNNMEHKHSIFISYSHEDTEWLKKIKTHLKPLSRYYGIDEWDDQKLRASDKWKDEITKALMHATIAILIVSPDFVASDFITNEELQPLLDKAQIEGTKIMPVIVRPCAYFEETGLSKYQAVNDPKMPLLGMSTYEQESKLVEMVTAIKDIVKKKV